MLRQPDMQQPVQFRTLLMADQDSSLTHHGTATRMSSTHTLSLPVSAHVCWVHTHTHRYGIMFVTFISWLPNHKATYFGEESQVPGVWVGGATCATGRATTTLSAARFQHSQSHGGRGWEGEWGQATPPTAGCTLEPAFSHHTVQPSPAPKTNHLHS